MTIFATCFILISEKIEMSVQLTFACVLALLCCTPGYTQNCTDCIDFNKCAGALAAGEHLKACKMKLPTCVMAQSSLMTEQIKRSTCGFDDHGVAMVCCSDLTARVETVLGSVEYHPNSHLLPDNCGDFEEVVITARVSGGIPVLGLYDYPWMVFISYNTPAGPRFQCGGSLINDRYVLTAAHCLTSKVVLSVRIRESEVETTGAQTNIPVEEATAHPEYRRKPIVTNDIGLLRLQYPVNLISKNAGTICLPVTRELQNRDIIGQKGIVAQRRKAEENYEAVTLLYVDVSIYSLQYCQEQYNSNRKHGEPDTMINKTCSDSNLMGACRGVSGGPLMLWGRLRGHDRFIQYGLVSYGPNRCGTTFPEVYTDVTKYMTWILNTIRP